MPVAASANAPVRPAGLRCSHACGAGQRQPEGGADEHPRQRPEPAPLHGQDQQQDDAEQRDATADPGQHPAARALLAELLAQRLTRHGLVRRLRREVPLLRRRLGRLPLVLRRPHAAAASEAEAGAAVGGAAARPAAASVPAAAAVSAAQPASALRQASALQQASALRSASALQPASAHPGRSAVRNPPLRADAPGRRSHAASRRSTFASVVIPDSVTHRPPPADP